MNDSPKPDNKILYCLCYFWGLFLFPIWGVKKADKTETLKMHINQGFIISVIYLLSFSSFLVTQETFLLIDYKSPHFMMVTTITLYVTIVFLILSGFKLFLLISILRGRNRKIKIPKFLKIIK